MLGRNSDDDNYRGIFDSPPITDEQSDITPETYEQSLLKAKKTKILLIIFSVTILFTICLIIAVRWILMARIL